MITVLVVDDNALNLKLVEYVLAASSYTVLTAKDAPSALAVLADARPDLILMDLQLPGMDGFELTRRLKADPRISGVVIVALSAYAMKGDHERALEAGCDGYLAKPVDTRTLPGVIRDYVEGKRPASEGG